MGMTPAQKRYYDSAKGKAQRRAWYAANAERLSQERRQRLELLREKVFKKYGAVCVCCGETELAFLCIDHKEGGGRAERATKSGGVGWYRYLLQNPKRKDLQILCANCNMAKERLVGCPHQQAR